MFISSFNLRKMHEDLILILWINSPQNNGKCQRVPTVKALHSPGPVSLQVHKSLHTLLSPSSPGQDLSTGLTTKSSRTACPSALPFSSNVLTETGNCGYWEVINAQASRDQEWADGGRKECSPTMPRYFIIDPELVEKVTSHLS